ncbi:MAG TPA: NAD(P)-dependent oxidoreductase [Acidimicrobiia bacterium]|jgi:phosphoglycerate dehydrogenase-like enzyme|nr:NAD(P)-dependent oxidoreductase [Acidimicrobiia bacterium]
MKPTSFLINTSRGLIVNEMALLGAVRSGGIAGAALDVYSQEPLPVDHPFRSEPRIITTPHLGYLTRDNYVTYYEGAIESILACQNGDLIRVLV